MGIINFVLDVADPVKKDRCKKSMLFNVGLFGAASVMKIQLKKAQQQEKANQQKSQQRLKALLNEREAERKAKAIAALRKSRAAELKYIDKKDKEAIREHKAITKDMLAMIRQS